MYVTLAAVLALVGAVAATYHFAMRPVTLRIAVGPASSDDVKVVQTLSQAFIQARGQVRLRPMQTDGAKASAQALADGKADLAIIRGDLDVPKNAQAVATLRKNVAVLWVPPAAKLKGKKAVPRITKIAQLSGQRIGVVGRTEANVNLLKVIFWRRKRSNSPAGASPGYSHQRAPLRDEAITNEAFDKLSPNGNRVWARTG